MEQGAGSMGQGAGGRSWKLGGGSWQIELWRPRYGRHPVRHNPAPSCVAQNGILLCRRLGVGKPAIVCCDRFGFRCLALRICFGFRISCFGSGALAPSPRRRRRRWRNPLLVAPVRIRHLNAPPPRCTDRPGNPQSRAPERIGLDAQRSARRETGWLVHRCALTPQTC